MMDICRAYVDNLKARARRSRDIARRETLKAEIYEEEAIRVQDALRNQIAADRKTKEEHLKEGRGNGDDAGVG